MTDDDKKMYLWTGGTVGVIAVAVILAFVFGLMPVTTG